MTKFIIRPARIEDAAGIARLNRDALGYDYGSERTKTRLEKVLSMPSNRLLVAELDNRCIGYIHVIDYDCVYVDSLKDILALAVEPDTQGKGVGRALLNAAEDWAKQCGCAGVRLESGFDRTGAHRFYEACGYSLRKEHKNFVKLF